VQIIALSLGQDDVVHHRAMLGPVKVECCHAGPGDVQGQLHGAMSWAAQVIE
jgi:hypothetical protein